MIEYDAPFTEIIIEPGRSFKNYWHDLWVYRELFYFLAWRDILVRYKQTLIGIAWSVIRPFLTMIIFTVVFGNIAKLPSSGTAPYAIMVFAALLPWQFFATALSDSSNSLVANSNLLTKVYFPRLIVPSSAIIISVVDFLISFVIMLALMVWYHFMPSINILLLPLFFIYAVIFTLGTGLWFATLNVLYRDVRIVIPFIVQIGMYISPVGFNSSIVPEKYRLLYSLNPMVGVIDGFRWSIIGNTSLYVPGFILSILMTILLFIGGLWYFRKMEKGFADVI
jgi:lipopolysaccharide transport system permease protein